ncbi:Uncharacterized protein HSBGL_0897 [Halapricum desulfuricans]|uniref:Uncharacterized protein n=1 Tax=Halapricum desulfuricans TaxID=2841257 RepID=A0A897NF58_9EURY|nr:hypothetical protein [Halapricum desulfuricans]QSG11327.1 Uncharacterized protein HSBGL_0897 [Halapricum desulfuricans]
MRIVTETCPNCGTIVAGNVLASERVMNCPGLDCEQVLSFEDLSPEDRQYVREHAARERT